MKQDVVLITGASAGIGRAIARELVRRGARVALAARRKERLDELAAELDASGNTVLALECDVTREGDPEAAVAAVVAQWGRLDTVIANAGYGVLGRLETLPIEAFRAQLETNLFGVLRTVKAAIPELKKTRGRIGVVGSVNGYIGTPSASAYCASKFAVRGVCDSLRAELADQGVSVTHLAPGFVESEIRLKQADGPVPPQAEDPVPSWLVASAESAAKEICDALEWRSRERIVTLHGKVFVWFERHFPWLVSRLTGLADPEKLPKSRRT